MSSIKRLKGAKKNRHNSKAGHRNRAKQKKAVSKRKRLKVLAQRLNKKPVPAFPDITIIEEI